MFPTLVDLVPGWVQVPPKPAPSLANHAHGPHLLPFLYTPLGIDDNADLYYPDQFLGTWQCVSVLMNVDIPQGSHTPDPASLRNFTHRMVIQ